MAHRIALTFFNAVFPLKRINCLTCYRRFGILLILPHAGIVVNMGKQKMEDQRLTITVEEAGRILGISRGLAYQMAREGGIPTVRFGKRLVVPKWAIEYLLQKPGALTPNE
jgi:excisionase family DNA binding protein